MKISEIAELVRDRISTAEIALNAYISTDSMIPNFGGVKQASSVPAGTAIAYRAGDILFSNIRPYFRKIWLADRSGGCNADVLCIRAKPEMCLPAFLYYVLSTENFIADYLKGCKGAKMPRGEVARLMDYEVDLPPLPVQRRIAGVLGAMDEKIAVNRRKIAELEALAKTVYDYWFVQFDFPDAHGRPYRSSGGKMTWNASLKREVPEGWEVAGVSDCGNFCRGVSYSKHDELVKGTPGSISVLRGNNIAGGFVIKDSNEVFVSSALVSADQHLKRGDLLIAMSSGSKDHVGKCGLITHDLETCTFGAFCSVFRPSEVYRFFVYDYLRGQAYRTYIQQICAGTGINNLKLDHFATLQFALPCDLDLMEKFNKLQRSFFDQIMILDEECEALTLQRDTLLPLLMNGQVEVAADCESTYYNNWIREGRGGAAAARPTTPGFKGESDFE